jgi:uncharacterized protein with HEPN domain
MDKTNTTELVSYILESIELIKLRFKDIKSSSDFLDDDNGLTNLDAISMRLQTIGEALKNIDKRNREFLLQVADKNYWSDIIKTREVISHHYIDIDSEVVFEICNDELKELENKIVKLKKSLYT